MLFLFCLVLLILLPNHISVRKSGWTLNKKERMSRAHWWGWRDQSKNDGVERPFLFSLLADFDARLITLSAGSRVRSFTRSAIALFIHEYIAQNNVLSRKKQRNKKKQRKEEKQVIFVRCCSYAIILFMSRSWGLFRHHWHKPIRLLLLSLVVFSLMALLSLDSVWLAFSQGSWKQTKRRQSATWIATAMHWRCTLELWPFSCVLWPWSAVFRADMAGIECA